MAGRDLRNPPDWTSLPYHLLSMIAHYLHTRIDILRFRAVCNTFRLSVALPPKPISPLSSLKMPIPFPRYLNVGFHLLLTQSTLYALEPLEPIPDSDEITPKTWFINVRELGSGKVRLQDPICSFSLKSLHCKLPETLNLLDYRVKELNKVYGLKAVALDEDFKHTYTKKVVVSSSLDAVMAIYNGEKLGDFRLGLWRKGDEEWTHIDLGIEWDFYEDIVFHNEKFYALEGSSGLTVTVNPKTLNITEVAAPVAPLGNDDHKHLVKSDSDLFMVEKEFLDGYSVIGTYDKCYPIHLNVFKLDEEKHKWVRLTESLKDRVLFCTDASFSVSANEFLGCKTNSVYFTDNIFSDGNDDHPGSDAGIFDFANSRVALVSDFPGYSNIFWPPPSWLKHNSECF